MTIRFSVVITKVAEGDIREIFEYILSDNHSAATKWIEKIESQVDSLERFPMRCQVIPEAQELKEEYRHFVFSNYRTIIRVEKSRVLIMRVIHAARLLDLGMFEK